jgi:sulfur transfer protein SufE
VAGLIAIPIFIFNEQSPTEILQTQIDWLRAFDLQEHILSTRLTGFEAGVKKIRKIAEDCLAQL